MIWRASHFGLTSPPPIGEDTPNVGRFTSLGADTIVLKDATLEKAPGGDLLFKDLIGTSFVGTRSQDAFREISGLTSPTILPSDIGGWVFVDSPVPVTVTLTGVFQRGHHTRIVQAGDGQVTIAVDINSTISNREGHTKTAGKGAVAHVLAVAKPDTTTFVFAGDTAA